jgi:hypothetical protein
MEGRKVARFFFFFLALAAALRRRARLSARARRSGRTLALIRWIASSLGRLQRCLLRLAGEIQPYDRWHKGKLKISESETQQARNSTIL